MLIAPVQCLHTDSVTIGEEEDQSKYDFAYIVLKWQLHTKYCILVHTIYITAHPMGEEEDLSKYDFASIVFKWQLAPDEEGELGEVETEEEGGGKLATFI